MSLLAVPSPPPLENFWLSFWTLRNAGAKRSSLAWRLGDAFVPEPLRTQLYKPWFRLQVNSSGDEIHLNYWSWAHFASGATFALLFPRSQWWHLILVHTLWEAYQVAIGMSDIRGPRRISEYLDIAFDTLFALVGFLVAKKCVALYKESKMA